jgi:hypothetical protein
MLGVAVTAAVPVGRIRATVERWIPRPQIPHPYPDAHYRCIATNTADGKLHGSLVISG